MTINSQIHVEDVACKEVSTKLSKDDGHID